MINGKEVTHRKKSQSHTMDIFLNQLLLENGSIYFLIEEIIYAAGGVLSVFLSVLSICTYRRTGLPKIKYAIGAFALLATFLFYEYLELGFKDVVSTPFTEIFLPSLILASVVFFFLAIVRKR